MVLFFEGGRRPPRNDRSRLAWAIGVLVVCAGLLPFFVAGVVERSGAGEPFAAIVFVVACLCLLFGAVAAVVVMVRLARHRRGR